MKSLVCCHVAGISKLQLDRAKLNADLDSSWEVLAEPIQTVMRRCASQQPYSLCEGLLFKLSSFHATCVDVLWLLSRAMHPMAPIQCLQ